MSFSEVPCWRLTEVCAVSTLCGCASGLMSVWSVPVTAAAAGGYVWATEPAAQDLSDL